MTNKHIELPALARTLAYDVQAETIGPALADMISDTLNRCADAIAAHEQALVVGEPVAWMPIETAPKDRTEILACWPKRKLDDDECPTGEITGYALCVTVWQGFWIEPDYLEAHGSFYFEDEAFAAEPTHWMPLPAAPGVASPPAPQEAQADSTPLLPVARIRSWTKHGEGHGDLVDWLEGSENLPDGEYDLYLGPQSEQKPVASIYISPNGEREFDDWKHDLPIGRNELFAAPVAQPATEQAEAPPQTLRPYGDSPDDDIWAGDDMMGASS